jgi:NAD+ diphosphatase
MEAPITFAGPGLDRAPEARRRPEWVAERWADPAARTLIASERGVWVERGDGAARPALGRPAELGASPDDAVLLGLDGERPLFAVDAEALDGGAPPGEPVGLRQLAAELSERDAGVVAYAVALLNWHRRHRFCSVCGNASDQVDAGHERRCPACGSSHFPRTDPVIIVAVSDGERLLLGHQAVWPESRYSVLAGYVEPGETLEQAVRREVLEESQVELGEVRYEASQPWPFPSSLMVGFSADARADSIPHADGDELADVRWFTREEVAAAAGWDGQGELLLPQGFSIARRLIDRWLARG